MTRTDVHAPSSPNFDPEAYTCYGVFDMIPEFPNPTLDQHRRDVINALVEDGYRHGPGSSCQCGHCGAHIRYAALMVREDVREYIYVGETCLDGRFAMTKGEFDTLRKAAALDRQRAVKRDRFVDLCGQYPGLVWATYASNISFALCHEARVLGFDREGFSGDDHLFAGSGSGLSWGLGVQEDIAYRTRHYGSISEKQAALLDRIAAEQESKWAAYVAREQAKREEPVVVLQEGRYEIEGEVLSTKWVDNDFGGALKMLVRRGDGTKVWGTVPRSIEVDKGDRVTFTAAVIRSRDDAAFGFFSRPTRAAVLQGVS